MKPWPLQLALLGLLGGPAAAGDEWLKLSSSHFELYTNAGERTGRDALTRFEQIRRVFHDLDGNQRASPLPVRVFVFDSEKDFRPFRPTESTLGFYQGGPERNYVAMQTAGAQTYRVVFHEYVHLVLNHSSARLPQWLEEGIAEFYSTVEASGDRLYIGRLILPHVQTLNRRRWLEAERLANVDHGSPEYSETGKAGIFYAQSWALVHMLNLAPGYRERLPRYAELLAGGEPAATAFDKAFEKSLAQALRDLGGYLSGGRLPVVEVSWEQPEPVTFQKEVLSPAAARLAQMELLLQLGRADTAEGMLRELARQAPDSAEVETALGMLEMSRRRFERARDHLERSIRLGSRRAGTYFEYAMLLRETVNEPSLVRANLEKTVELNPNFAEAHFLLGVMAANEGRHREAIEPLRRAVSVLPRQAYFWHALALAYHETGEPDLARRAAHRALEAARTEQEAEMSRAAIRMVEEKASPEVAQRPAVTTPESWQNRQGDSRVEGVLERIDCLGPSARFRILAAQERISLHVANPGEVLLKNLSSVTFEFSCGPQKPRRIVVDYIRKPDAKTATAGEITAIEFP